MKIICIGRNYVKHAEELKSEVPDEPVYFMKPASCLVNNNKPFFYPDFSKEIHYETEIIIKINRLGKNISKQYASRYFDEIGIGIDFTARDIQREQIKKGLPWEKAKAFDNAAPMSRFVHKENFQDINNLSFHLTINDKMVQQGSTKDMIFNFDDLIAYVSQFMTLKIGDLIFTGTPAGVGPVHINDQLKAYIENEKYLDFFIK